MEISTILNIFILVSSSFMVTTLSEDPDMTPFFKEITTDLYVSFDNETKDERPKSVIDMMDATRKYYMAHKKYFEEHYGEVDMKIIACYMISVTYKSAILALPRMPLLDCDLFKKLLYFLLATFVSPGNGRILLAVATPYWFTMWDLRRYFNIRYLYSNSMEFEIGYLCHEIIYRYQLVLELYQMVERRFVNLENRNFAPVTYIFYVYTNILHQSKDIIHLCHMLHEVERKYRGKMGVFDDYEDNRQSKLNKTAVSDSDLALEKWLQKKKQEEKRRKKERKKYLKQVQKFGLTTTKKKKMNRTRSWPIQYGWSIENW